MDVREGDQFRMGKVSFTGLTENAAAALYKLWKLHPGGVYDVSYPGLFLTTAGTHFNLSTFKVQMSQVIQADSELIDLAAAIYSLIGTAKLNGPPSCRVPEMQTCLFLFGTTSQRVRGPERREAPDSKYPKIFFVPIVFGQEDCDTPLEVL